MAAALVTGADGFLGRNLCLALERCAEAEVLRFDVQHEPSALDPLVARADFIFHLAGVNRPQNEDEFVTGNVDLTERLCSLAAGHGRTVPILLSSSTQAALDNPYGRSKRAAEKVVWDYQRRTGAAAVVYRFPNLFGKWSRPNYNSVVSTFCHCIACGEPIDVHAPEREVTLAYVDDVVAVCLDAWQRRATLPHSDKPCELQETYTLTLGQLAALLQGFHAARTGAPLPDFSQPLIRKLYATFLSYYDADQLATAPTLHTDQRGWLFELVKSPFFGQIFVSSTAPGVTRGQHAHDTKTEKFCVVQGTGTIRLRHLATNEQVAYAVSGDHIRIVDIPPGYAHSIENTGDIEMITLFWASEVFDPEKPDTHYEEV